MPGEKPEPGRNGEVAMQDEDKIFGLIAQAEDIQKHAIALQRAAQDAVKTLPDASRGAVRDAAREFIIEGAEKASRGILDASNDAKATSTALRRTGLFLSVFLIAVALVMAGAGFAVMNFYGKSKLQELAELKAAIRTEQATLNELQSKTWGLELLTINGKRWIRFKRGDTPGETGTWENGKWHGIEVKP